MSNSQKGKNMMDAGAPHILIYTTPSCPDCHALKRWLSQQGVAYEERDLTNPGIADEAKARTGVRVAPISIIGSEIFYGTFRSQRPGLVKALRLAKVHSGARHMTAKRVNIQQSQANFEVQDGQTILDAALATGVPYPYGCKSGRCGACKSRLIAGKVDLLQHSPFALTDDEKADGLILACRALPESDVTVSWLVSNNDVVQPPKLLNGVVTHLFDLTHDIKFVRIMPDEAVPLLFTAGQYAQVSFDGVPARSYSMANWHGNAGLEFHIRCVPGGITSEHVHNELKIGDKASFEFPLGTASLRSNHSGPILCIAGGSGLAPIKSIVETALAHGMKQPIHVFFGVRAERDLYLIEHFQTLAKQHPNLIFTPVLSEAQSAQYRVGFVTQAVAEDIDDLDGWKAYIAGPPPMVDAAMEVVFARGLHKEDIHADVFFTQE